MLTQEEIQYLMNPELNLCIHSYLETHDIIKINLIQSKIISFGFNIALLLSKYFSSVDFIKICFSSEGTAKMTESSYNCSFYKDTLKYRIIPAISPATIPIA